MGIYVNANSRFIIADLLFTLAEAIFIMVGVIITMAGDTFINAEAIFMLAGDIIITAGCSFINAEAIFMLAGNSFVIADAFFINADASCIMAEDIFYLEVQIIERVENRKRFAWQTYRNCCLFIVECCLKKIPLVVEMILGEICFVAAYFLDFLNRIPLTCANSGLLVP